MTADAHALPSGPIRDDGADSLVFIKAVPGARRDEIAGLLGSRVKVRISAPPEGGKANTAICELLAAALGIRVRSVQIESGHARPEKTIRVIGLRAAEIARMLDLK